jgi:hypothetical protein
MDCEAREKWRNQAAKPNNPMANAASFRGDDWAGILDLSAISWAEAKSAPTVPRPL